MKILFWNVRGINMPSKQRELKRYFMQYNANIICLLETHVQRQNFLAISSFLLPGWPGHNNYEYASLGRIWVFHRHHIQITVSSVTSQAMHCHTFDSITGKYFFLSVIYANSYHKNVRQELWKELVLINKALPKVPWLVRGDFNEIRSIDERSDWRQSLALAKSSIFFQNQLNEAELHDLPSSGSYFT
ncbi:hypothetical protein SLA2020_048250 [Shorea laevis]